MDTVLETSLDSYENEVFLPSVYVPYPEADFIVPRIHLSLVPLKYFLPFTEFLMLYNPLQWSNQMVFDFQDSFSSFLADFDQAKFTNLSVDEYSAFSDYRISTIQSMTDTIIKLLQVRNILTSKRVYHAIIKEIPQITSFPYNGCYKRHICKVNEVFHTGVYPYKSLYYLVDLLKLAHKISFQTNLPSALARIFTTPEHFEAIDLITDTRIGMILACLKLFVFTQHKGHKEIRVSQDEHYVYAETKLDEVTPICMDRFTTTSDLMVSPRDLLKSLALPYGVTLVDEFTPDDEDATEYWYPDVPKDDLTFDLPEQNEHAYLLDISCFKYDFGEYGYVTFRPSEKNPLSWLQIASRLTQIYEFSVIVTETLPEHLQSPSFDEFLSSVFVLSRN